MICFRQILNFLRKFVYVCDLMYVLKRFFGEITICRLKEGGKKQISFQYQLFGLPHVDCRLYGSFQVSYVFVIIWSVDYFYFIKIELYCTFPLSVKNPFYLLFFQWDTWTKLVTWLCWYMPLNTMRRPNRALMVSFFVGGVV